MSEPMMPTLTTFEAPSIPFEGRGEVVEIALLLPKKRAEALIELAHRRHQSVGQMLRGLIDRAVVEDGN